MGFAVPAAMGAKVGVPGPDGLGDRRRRLLPDDQPGAGHLRDQRHPDQGRDHQQRVARHGAAVADAVLQRALLQHRPALQADPRLRQARRRLRLRRPLPASRPRTSTPRSRRRWRSTTCRWSSTSGCTATRWSGRWWPPAPATTTSSTPATWRPTSRRTTLMSTPHPVRPGREQARRAGPDRRPVQPPRLQHRLPRGRPDRAPRGLADDDRGQRRGLAARAGHQAAQQAGRGDQDRRARPGGLGQPRADHGQGLGRPPRPADRCSTPSSCSAPP